MNSLKVSVIVLSILTLFYTSTLAQSSEDFEFTVQTNPTAECLPEGDYKVIGDTIYKCENKKLVKIEGCTFGIIYDENNVPKCQIPPSQRGFKIENRIEQPPLLEIIDNKLTWLILGLVLGSGVVYFIFKRVGKQRL